MFKGFWTIFSLGAPVWRLTQSAIESTWKIISRGSRPGKTAGNLSHPGMKFETQSSRKEGASDEMLFIPFSFRFLFERFQNTL